jgi:PAS domain S-box-containing protein
VSELEMLQQRVRELEDVNRRVGSAEAALRASEQIIRRVLETVPSGIVHVGSRGDIRLANQTAQDFLGLGFDELTSSFTVDFAGETFYEDGRLCPVEEYPVSRCLITGEPQPRMTIGVRQRSGDIRWAIFTAMPVDLEDGRGAVVTFVDITDRRAAEEEREAMTSRVAQAERMASLGTLAAGLAHEINNPLTFLLGNLELALLGSGLPADLRRQLGDARDGGTRIARIVKDIGAFARRDSAQIAPFDVGDALEEAIRLTQPQHRHRARITTHIAPGSVGVGQEWRAVQVFVNLLSNAALACPAGHADEHEIRVRVGVESGEVVARIEDDGCGMGPDEVARAFVPFFTTRDVGLGTGLGLSISHGIVAGMGGSIELESELGVGTVVTVRLPQSSVAAAPRDRSGGATPPAQPQEGRLSVLVVDDEPAIREIARAALSSHELTAVASGRAALDACASRAFDAVLLDLMMPELTGADVLRALETSNPEQAARVVIMTGGVYTAEMPTFVEEGAHPVISKPFSLVALEEAVRAAAARGR